GRAALATVVRVRGSAYRHEGAKLLVAQDGGTTGNVSGGCLEQDVREVALQVLRTGRPELRSYCSGADEVAAWDLGVGCEGEVEVFVEPVTEPRPRERELLDGRRPFAVCSMMPAEGEGGRGRLIVTQEAADGELGSPDLNARAAGRARRLLGTEQRVLAALGGRTGVLEVFCVPPQRVPLDAGGRAR